MSESIAYYYLADKNPEGGTLPGVPLADLTQAQFDAYPPWLQASIAALDCYRKTKPKAAEPKE
jgi:hypothetical protein